MTSDANAIPLPGLPREQRAEPRTGPDPEAAIRRAEELRRGLTGNFRDEAVSSIYARSGAHLAAGRASAAVTRGATGISASIGS